VLCQKLRDCHLFVCCGGGQRECKLAPIKTNMKQHFTAVIFKVGINPCVDIPQKVSRAFNKRGYVPVKGMINGKRLIANLVPIGNNRHRLFINGDMRNRAKVDVHDRIELILEVDSRPRIEPMTKGLSLVLSRNKSAMSNWEMLAPSRRKEILRYLNFAKRPETLQRNIHKVIALLTKKPYKSKTLGGIRINPVSGVRMKKKRGR
jgi:hypothetical protein